MKININDQIDVVLPWECVLVVNGTEFPTRPPTVAEIAALSDLAPLTDAQAKQLFSGVFVGETPSLDDGKMALKMVTAYLAYFWEHSRKNSRATGAAIRAAVAESFKTQGK